MIPSKYHVDDLLIQHIKYGPTEHARRLERALLAWLSGEIDYMEFADVALRFDNERKRREIATVQIDSHQ